MVCCQVPSSCLPLLIKYALSLLLYHLGVGSGPRLSLLTWSTALLALTHLPAFSNLYPAIIAAFLKFILIMFLLVQNLLVVSQQLQGNLCFCVPTIPNPMWFPGMTLSPQVKGLCCFLSLGCPSKLIGWVSSYSFSKTWLR